MKPTRISLSGFRQDHSFYGGIDLLLTVKSFDLQAIRKRYLASRANRSGQAGSVERRQPAMGGVVRLRIEKGKVQQSRVLARLVEPRGIDCTKGHLSISSENTVYYWGRDGLRALQHPWFAYIHTVQFNPGGDRLLVSSSGFDCFFEFDLSLDDPVSNPSFSWFAWEHGFDQGRDPDTGNLVVLTRNPERADELRSQGKLVMQIPNPPQEAIPTARRAAFINSVTYGLETFVATFFHEGAVYAIDRISGHASRRLSGMRNPHGGRELENGTFLATSTGTGEVILSQKGEDEKRYDFSELPGKPEALGELEWLQNSVITGGVIVTIDSNRTSLVLFDPRRKLMDVIPYDENWAVQDLVLDQGIMEQAEVWLSGVSEEAD